MKMPSAKDELLQMNKPNEPEAKSLLTGEFREIPLDRIDPPKNPVRPVESQVVEVQRNDHLDAVTEGEVFSRLVRNGWTPKQIVDRIGKKQVPYVTNRILIAESLHPVLQSKVKYGGLNVGDAVRLAAHPLDEQLSLHRKTSKQKHGDPAENCNRKCPHHCPPRIGKED
jgi:hypothetical protein